jgi:hypothetical protein
MSYLSRTKQQENRFETMYILQDDSGFVLETPGGTKGGTRFRAFPSFDDQGNELPMRIARDDGFGNVFFEDSDFTDWIYPEYGVRGAGSKGRFTAFFRPKGGGDQDPSPFKVFWRTMGGSLYNDKEKGGGKFPAEWYNWLGSKDDKKIQMEAALKRPGLLTMLQGLCYGNRGKEYKDYSGNSAPKYPCVYLGLATTAGSFEELLNKKKVGITRAEKVEDFLVPDLISCQTGCMLDINLTDVGGRKGYVVNTGAFVPLDLTWVRSQRKPWDKILRLLTIEEQVEVLCTYFDVEAVDFALRGSPYEHLLPAEVRGSWDRLQGRGVTPIVPGVAPAQSAPVSMPRPVAVVPAGAAPRVPPPPGAVGVPSAAPVRAQSAPVPFAGGVAMASKPVVPFSPAVPPPPPASSIAGKFAQEAAAPTGDASTDLKNMGTIRERLVRATNALSDPPLAESEE